MLTRLRSYDGCAVALALAVALVVALASCGDGSSTTVASNSGTGTVVVVVTDAATDDFAQIWVRVRKVELIGSQGHFTLFEGRRVIDLLSMRDDARLLSLGREVPAGDWSKIRLHVDDVTLIRVVDEDDAGEAGTEVDCPDEVDPDPGFVCESIDAKVVANGKIDLNPRGPITVRSGDLVFVQLDLDANKSIHIVETGNHRFIFRPVVFVDLFAVRPDRLMRIEGTIGEIDRGARTLLVCGTHLVFRPNAQQDTAMRNRCVDVRVGTETSIFDADGRPADLGDLDEGDEIAALGRFRVGTGESLVFDALWIQQGGFDAGLFVTGEVVSGVSGNQFAIEPDPDGPVDVDPLTVRLLSGAKLFDHAGEEVDPGDLQPGVRVRVFGVLAGDRLNASLVFVRERADLARLHGTVTHGFDPGQGALVISQAPTTQVPTCVAIGSGDDVFRIRDEGDQLSMDRIAPGDLRVGEVIDVFGHAASPCFDAETVISFGENGS